MACSVVTVFQFRVGAGRERFFDGGIRQFGFAVIDRAMQIDLPT